MRLLSFQHLRRLRRQRWLGPHFYYDLIRLARKGWPTLARVLYLIVLLVSMAVMYRMQTRHSEFLRPSQYAASAHNYAYTLIALQNILVLVLLPVYVASSIAEEKENRTLEALTLTHLTDRELVLGKLGARLLHLGAVVLSSFPLLAFMHLWGQVDVALLVYHEANTLLLLLSAGGVCTLVSTYSESAFQAISRSYPWLFLMGLIAVPMSFALPWICGGAAGAVAGARGSPSPLFAPALVMVLAGHLTLAAITLSEAIKRMEYLRRAEQRGLRKSTGALALTDMPAPQRAPGKRGQVRSRIHPWAWPVRGDAVFWKECIKDGTSWSLSARWVLIGLTLVFVAALCYHGLYAISGREGRLVLRGNAYSFSFTSYCVGLAAYALVVLFQLTMSVAGEREHNTLTFLLLIPAERRSILRAKWLGPWWRNWPILAISYLGIILGFACGLYQPLTLLILVLLPWPFLLMAGGLALLLSVVCRRVLFANIAAVGLLGVLFIAHVAAGEPSRVAASFFIALIGEIPLSGLIKDVSWSEAALLALTEQALFLCIALACSRVAFWRFGRRDYATL